MLRGVAYRANLISTMSPSILAILRPALGFAMMAGSFSDWILAAPVSSYKIVAEFRIRSTATPKASSVVTVSSTRGRG
jgi:hypothetical protein